MRPTVVAPAKRIAETDPGYAVARLRGMRAHLLDASFYERLIDAPDISALIKALMDTTYAEDLEEETVHGRTASSVDEALKDNMVRAYRKVLGFLDSESRRSLETLLGHWDVFNMKTILRAAHNHVAHDEVVESLLPIGRLGTAELEALAGIDDVRAVIDTAVMWKLPVASSLRGAYPEYARTNDLAALELLMDREYAEWAAERLAGESVSEEITRIILATQIDAANLTMALRMAKEPVGPENVGEYFLEGGRGVRRELFIELARMSDVDQVLDRLKGSPFGQALDAAAVLFLETQSLSVFERALEELLMHRATSAGVRDPHGVGVAIAFLWGKRNEVTNVRIVVRGKAVGMPADRVRRELILV